MKSISRPVYAGFIAVIILLGFFSRTRWMPAFVLDYVGDTLYATLAFFGFGFLSPKSSSYKIAIFAILFCFVIEISQLYHAPWIDAIRHMRFGGLVLGFGFLWSDLACYSVGVGVGFVAERLMSKK